MDHTLELKLLEEGVETNKQRRILRAQECDEVEGYLYGRPVSAERLINMLENL